MLPAVYQVTKIGSGVLSVMAKPVSGEWIHEEFLGLATLGIHKVVSLLQRDEELELGLGEEQKLCEKLGIEFERFPIPDRGLPATEKARKLATAIYTKIYAGQHIVVHCRAGIGRTGIIAGAILKEAGYETYSAIQAISKARGVRVPDTVAQEEWLAKYEAIVFL